jgi:hypothetical protein
MRQRRDVLGYLVVAATAMTGCLSEPDCPSPDPNWISVYECFSDSELLAEIAKVDGRVGIGFKEAGMRRGVDPQGRNLTSAETTQSMKAFLLDRGITLIFQGGKMPAVGGRMPLRLELVTELRRHPNIDYVEPDIPGTFHSP